MSKLQLLLLLGLYYIDKGKNVERFTARYNQYFKQDISKETVLFGVSKYRVIDPSNNMKTSNEEAVYSAIWNEYIGQNRIQELKAL